MTDITPKHVAKAFDTLASFFSELIEVHNEETGTKEKLDVNRSLIKTFLGNQIWKLTDMRKFAIDTQKKIVDRATFQHRNLGSRDITQEDLEKTAGQLERQNYRVVLIEAALLEANIAYEKWVGDVYTSGKTQPKSVDQMSPAELRLLAAMQAGAGAGVNTDRAA